MGLEWEARHGVGVRLGETATAAGVVAPLLLVALARYVPWPGIPLPSVDLPSLPLPDVSIPLPRPRPPQWLREVLDKAGYVWPVLLAAAVAYGEVRRRRAQDRSRDPSDRGAED